MKRSHIIALAAMAVAVMVIISTVGDASTYASFSEAKTLAQEGSSKPILVVGELKKSASGEIYGMKYEPAIDPNHFEFWMIDSLQNESLVIYNQPKPQDLDKSEKVVVVGKMDVEADVFRAEQILLKCPSKYNNGELQTEKAVALKQ